MKDDNTKRARGYSIKQLAIAALLIATIVICVFAYVQTPGPQPIIGILGALVGLLKLRDA